jgi:hypothetical protein
MVGHTADENPFGFVLRLVILFEAVAEIPEYL